MMGNPLPPTAWTTGTTEVFKTGTWRAALPRHISAPSPCHAACPVDGDIAQWIGHAREGDFRAAWEILMRNNPFPAIAGRVCHHPCETACNRSGFDTALAICRLERYIGDLALAEGWEVPAPERNRPECIAIVGGGPSGLSAAYHLRRRGYVVTLFEARAYLGGLMCEGIPAYRLPRAVIHSEIGRILNLGVEVRLNEALDTPAAFADLRQRYDAVYLAIGAQRQKRLPALDYAKPWVMEGAQWLAQANTGAPPALGKRIVVVGGGSAAIDVARSARRIGHEVTLLALEQEAEMPAQREEVEEALDEGVQLCAGAMLCHAVQGETGVIALDCQRVNFTAGAERGAFRVEPIAGGEFRLEADAVVASIGQDPKLLGLEGTLQTRGSLLHVADDQATSADGVYAGGDVASTARFITEAVGMGKRAALSIDAALTKERDAPPQPALAGSRRLGAGLPSERPVPSDAIATFYYPRSARPSESRLGVEERLLGDAEVQLGLASEQALAEAARCFSCGTCIRCDNCYNYCPDLAVKRVPGGYEVDGDYCKGCGICVRECPTGAMEMMEDHR